MGISEAFYIPTALALITDFHRGPTRSRAVGLHQMGIYLGVIAGGFGGYVADSPALGWRWAFDLCGIVGIVYALPLFLLLRNAGPATGSGAVAVRSSGGPGRAVRELLGNGSFILLVLYFTLPAMAGWIVRDWMPAILRAEFGIGQGLAGVSAALYWQVAAIVGAIAGGWLADRWMRRTIRGRIYASALGMALIVPAMFGVGYAPETGLLWVAVMFLILFGVGWGFFDANNMPILSQIVRPSLRATGYGIMNFVSIGCGGIADWGFGALRDRQVPLFGIFAVFASAAVVSAVLVLLIRPRDTESEELG
jgi:MFS family permease